IIQLELALLDQPHDGGRRELLGYGREFKDCVRRDRRIIFEIGKPIAIHLDDFSIFDDYKRESRNTALLHLVLNVFISSGRTKRRIGILEPGLIDRDVELDLIEPGDERRCTVSERQLDTAHLS